VSRFSVRIPWVLLAVAELVLLAVRLRPWAELVRLSEQGAASYDPLVFLLVYIVVLCWVGGRRPEPFQQTLMAASGLAIPAGVLSMVAVVLAERSQPVAILLLRCGLLAASSLFWGAAGIGGERRTGSPRVAIVAGVWSGMASALMVVAVLLARGFSSLNVAALASDGHLMLGDPAVDALVMVLQRSTKFLLLAPLVGGAMGLLLASAAIQREEKKLRESEAGGIVPPRGRLRFP
jgi:heme A synthase